MSTHSEQLLINARAQGPFADPFFLINEPVIKEGQVARINGAGILLGPNPGHHLLETISQEREIDLEVFAVGLELLKRLKMGLPLAQGGRHQDAHQRVLSAESVSSLGSVPHAGGRSKAPYPTGCATRCTSATEVALERALWHSEELQRGGTSLTWKGEETR
jgi:hypothetical protein